MQLIVKIFNLLLHVPIVFIIDSKLNHLYISKIGALRNRCFGYVVLVTMFTCVYHWQYRMDSPA